MVIVMVRATRTMALLVIVMVRATRTMATRTMTARGAEPP